MRRFAWLILCAGCGSSPPPADLPPTDPAAVLATLTDLAALGAKHVGGEADGAAASYVRARFEEAGLQSIVYEPFRFPRHQADAAAMTIAIDGAAQPTIAFEVFDGSGSGHVVTDVVWVGEARPTDLAAIDVRGKVAMVQRVQNYHRSTQYLNIEGAGAAAMLFASTAPSNLAQVGSVRRDWEALGDVPAITVGKDDAAAIQAALTLGKHVVATIDVDCSSAPAVGQNVIGVIPGKQPGEIVIGAHFDSWFAGSTDNGGGVAALLALAERRAKRPQPAYTLVFVGYDGEEVALYGGYQFLRRHRIVAQEPILAVLNFEVPSANGSSLLGLARSNVDPLDQALRSADLNDTYVLYAAMDYVPILFGGIIPTDIQGIYRNGVPTASTAVDTPYYHTTEDTPDKVDTTFLAGAIDQFDQAIEALDADPADGFAASDPKLWKATVQPRARAAGQDLVVDVAVTDAGGAPQAMAPVRAALTVDDFFLAAHAAATTDGAGKATVTLPAGAAEAGQGDRWLHVTAGPDFPLVEELVPLP